MHILNSSMTHVYTFVTTAKNRMQNVSMTPDFLLRLLDQYLHHPCQSNHYSDFYQHRFILSVLELYTNFIIHCVLLSSACFERFNAFIASQCHNTRSLDFCVCFLLCSYLIQICHHLSIILLVDVCVFRLWLLLLLADFCLEISWTCLLVTCSLISLVYIHT